MKVSFVYPVYNEIENLPRIVGETRSIAEGLVSEMEIVLVDDGSTDGSGEFIDRLAADHPEVRALHHGCNRGLGAAIRTGLVNATKDLVLYMDSDFPVGIEDARAALGMLTDDVDLVIGRRLGRAECPRRQIMSWIYNRLISWSFGLRVSDVNFAFKLIRRSVLQQMHLRSEGSFIDAELLLESTRLGARTREVGIHYHRRVAGVSTAASSMVVLRILGEMWRYWRRWREGLVGPAHVVVNADDFGLREEINRGVAESFDRGIVTSASLLPTGDRFEDAVEAARARPGLDLGVHLALTQTRPISSPAEVPSLVDGGGKFVGDWKAFVRRYLRGDIQSDEVEREFRAQIERVRSTGLSLSHLDSHQHLHMLPGVLPVVVRLASEYGIGAVRYPRQRRSRGGEGGALAAFRRGAELAAVRVLCRLGRRSVKGNGLLTADDFRGFVEAGSWRSETLAAAIGDVEPGLTEIGCHPGSDDSVDSVLGWRYRWEQELAALTSPDVAAAVSHSGVRLTTYRSLLGGRD